ncbi:MAG: TRAP transporter small permease subunit [Tistlia sp.]|uniref:TRAP transporter small permease subunit n=1 Tax=Tistlia sp. TaxID=3057121 RepID=UPI0034A1220B
MLDLRVVDRLNRRIGEVVSYVFLVSVAIMAYEVAARYLFGAPTIWAHESTITLTALGFLFGGAYTLQRREHIQITALYRLFPRRVRWVADVVAHLVMLFYVGVLIYAGWIVAAKAWASMETSASAWNQPTPVVIKTALVVGSLLLALQGLVHLLQLLGLARRGDDDTEAR